MSTVLTESKTFEERMKERIKDSIGDLITDEDLSKMVERGVEEAFFKERPSGGGYNSTPKVPLMNEIVRELLEPTVRNAVAGYIKENQGQVKEALDKVMLEGVGGAVLFALSSQFDTQLNNFKYQMEQSFTNNQSQY